ncbi:MAG: extracellular solute-binding protein [Eubacteriales bacterium]|nr:extracellular solute-binding protein [Eubacteriales bacterium]
MKKMLAILLSVALVLATTAALAEPVTVKFAAQADSTPATQAVVDAFNASQTNYMVEWVDMTNDSGAMREQLTTSLKAGSSEYDIISMDVVWAGEFAASGYIMPLDMMLDDAGLNVADYNAGSMASGNYNGKQYVLPFFPDLGMLYFRTDIVSQEDAAKLIAGTYTWADLLAMAETYAGQGGTTTGFVFQAALYEGLVCNANEFTSNWTDVKGGLEIMKQFIDSKASPDNILNYTEGETANSFVKGESVFARNWPYQWGVIKSEGTITTDQVAVAPLPGGSTVGGWILGINKNSANAEGAFAFMQFLNSEAGQLIMSEQGGYLPGLNKMLTDERIIKSDDRLSMVGFQNALKTTIARPVSAEYSKVSDALQQAIYPYLSGSAEIDATVTAVQAALAN